jgi:CBS domain-containing protein
VQELVDQHLADRPGVAPEHGDRIEPGVPQEAAVRADRAAAIGLERPVRVRVVPRVQRDHLVEPAREAAGRQLARDVVPGQVVAVGAHFRDLGPLEPAIDLDQREPQLDPAGAVAARELGELRDLLVHALDLGAREGAGERAAVEHDRDFEATHGIGQRRHRGAGGTEQRHDEGGGDQGPGAAGRHRACGNTTAEFTRGLRGPVLRSLGPERPSTRRHPMKVAELMRTDVKVIGPDATVAEAVELLADGHVSGLPVVDKHGRIVGVLSSTDILEAEAEATGADRDRLFDDTTVAEIMTPTPRLVAPDLDIREAAQQMLYLDVHRLFVEQNGKLAGVISQTDLVRALATSRV